MRKAISILLFVASKTLFACECPPLLPITKVACNDYDVLFLGHIDSVSVCDQRENGIACFTIDEVYKGNVTQQLKISFDCSSECLMSFTAGETWLMYATYKRFDLLTVSICGHSRKFFADESDDFYQVAAQRSFEQEKQFLEGTFGMQSFIESTKQGLQEINPIIRNEQPGGINKLVLLVVSFIVMISVYFVIKKRNGK